ncbi:ABC transporter ATP-binding protein [Litchfieldia alkalitelluris]|uniref:ABC transporter ATP-binding protein n=1 Tax=Litchfieldia alkalitelluris TaxID=304268 RepID=UPI000997D0D5|nr:ABC transporter ATP-binding protein [Litchfieldia alkalitelluris]
MEIFRLEQIEFSYPEQKDQILNGINLSIQQGEFVVLCGKTGCGKSTLLKHLKPELTPIGTRRGNIYYFNQSLEHTNASRLISEVGMVFQDPENQIVMDEVYQELIFGMENMGIENDVMRKRLAELVQFFDLDSLLYKKTYEISGGQKQMINLASILLLQPKVLLLDEPTSQLDPISSKEFIQLLYRINQEFGITIIMVEHRIEEVLPLADRLILLEQGKIIYDGQPKDVIYDSLSSSNNFFKPFIPSISKLFLEVEENVESSAIPLTVKEGKKWISELTINYAKELTDQKIINNKEVLINCKHVYFRYSRDSAYILKNLNLAINKGDFFSIVGKNGSGKSTLLKVCGLLLKPERGKLFYKGMSSRATKENILQKEVAYLPQNPKSFFTQDTLKEELSFQAEQLDIENRNTTISVIVNQFNLQKILDRHPYDCSGGEQQKAALACLLLSDPEILFIDEPTKGLDPTAKEQLGQLLQDLHKEGKTIVMSTHDIEFAARYSTRSGMIFDGDLTAIGSSAGFFKGNYFYTTSINRITRDHPGLEAVTIEEVREKWEMPR